MQQSPLESYYKDVTYETLKEKDFLEAVRKAFPSGDWDKAYDEFNAAGEKPLSKGKGR